MVFRKKEKPPLDVAIDLVNQAVEMAYKYKRDKKYIPNAAEFKRLDGLLEALWQNHSTLDYIIRCLRQRSRGEPEGAARWHDKACFDYHFPP